MLPSVVEVELRLVTVTARGELVLPTAVAGNFNDAGDILMDQYPVAVRL